MPNAIDRMLAYLDDVDENGMFPDTVDEPSTWADSLAEWATLREMIIRCAMNSGVAPERAVNLAVRFSMLARTLELAKNASPDALGGTSGRESLPAQ